jgi:hypothetical protein
MTQVDENPYGSTNSSGTNLNVLQHGPAGEGRDSPNTNSSGTNLNVLQHGLKAVKYMDVFYNPLAGHSEADAI